jgi:hypothetical protein
MTIKPGILFNFPLARYIPQVWRFRVTSRGLIIRAYDLYRRQAPAAKSVSEYLEFKRRPSEEDFSIYKQRSSAGFRARCIHNAHALIEMVDKVSKTIPLSEGKPTASHSSPWVSICPDLCSLGSGW